MAVNSPTSEELFGSPTNAARASEEVPGTVGATTRGWGHSLIDTRAYGKLRSFSGKEEDWATWSFVARSYLDLLSMGYRELLTSAEAAPQATEIKLVDMTDVSRTHAWTLFNVLTQSVEGRALSVIMNSEPSNGLQAWRLLVDAYEPRVGGRYTAMLMGIIGPQWGHVKEADFLESLDTWETQIRRYEDQSGEKVTAATKCAVVMKNAPGGIRTALRTSSSIIGSDYQLLKKAIKDYLQTGVEFDGRGLAAEAGRRADPNGPAPMDVGALNWWKGGKKGKDDKGKGKKGKQGKSKEGGKNVKGKFGKPSNPSGGKFQGNCSYCYKWGHKKADCRARERDKKGKGGSTNAVDKEDEKSTNAVQYQSLDNTQGDWDPEEVWQARRDTGKWPRIKYQDENPGGASASSGGVTEVVTTSRRGLPKATSSRKSWADEQEEEEAYEEVEEEEEDKESWVSAITREVSSVESNCAAITHSQYIMYDSGSDEHVCKPDFGGYGEEQKSTVKLNAVSGDALAILGERKVILTLAGREGPVEVEVVFQVSKNAQKNILSSGKMFRNGFKSIMDPEGASYLMHGFTQDCIPLYMYGNSFYLKLLAVKTVPMNTQIPEALVAPVSGMGSPEDWEHPEEQVEEADGGEDPPEAEITDRQIESKMSLTQDSTIKEMRQRLKDLGYVVHGNKADVWKRLKKAEKEEMKRQEKERLKNAEIQQRNEDLVQSGAQVKAPDQPTEAERARHALTHLPTAPWCEHCTKGKGRDNPHRRTDGDRAVVQVDYSYLKADGNVEETTEDAAEIVLTAADRQTGLFTALSIPAKKPEKDYVVKSLKAFVSQLGHLQVAIRSDGEPQILQICNELRDELNKLRGKEVVVKAYTEQAPRYSPQSMGAVGSAQRVLRGDFLTLRSAIEEKIGIKVTPAMNIWPWMVRHAAWTRGRFGVKANLRTAYEDAFGNPYTGQVLPFGESVLFKIPHSATGRKAGGRQLKGDPSWEQGVFLGKMNETDEFLVGNGKGVFSARSVRRLEERKRWSVEAVTSFRGVPWNRETTIGRPRKAVVAPETPQALASPSTPKPAQGSAGPQLPSARGSAAKRDEEPTNGPGAKKKARVEVTDSSARLVDDDEPMQQFDRPSGSGGANQGEKRTTEADREEVESAVKRWKQAEEVVESRFEGGPPKKLKVGEQTIGALFNAADEEVKAEEGLPEEEVDEDYMAKSQYFEAEDEESWVSVPITEEEEREGKKKELQKMDDFKTYAPVPASEAKGPILDSTWVKARKPDGTVRMRYCLREFKSSNYRDDVYAVSTTSATGRMIDLIGVNKKQCFFTADATNAFWQVPIEELCYMYPPKEWLEREAAAGRPTDVMWRLDKEWYGRRVAGTRWVEWAASKVMKLGCLRSELAPWLFHHPRLDISLELHMDDIYGCGPEKAVRQFLEELHKEINMKSEVHLPGCGEFFHLKRRRIFQKDGSLFIQSDSKHLAKVQKILELEGEKGAPTPAVAGGSSFVHAEEKLKDEDAARYKTAVGTVMYMAPDRPDCQFAIRELTKGLKDPTVGDMQALVRLTRYLIKTKTYGVKFEADENSEFLDCYSDTDWGNCKRTRKSTACGVFMVGKNVLASYCRGLAMICLSSGEAEFNGGVCASSEGLFYHQLLGFLGMNTKMRVHLDSSAARGVFQRQGAGRIRHLEIKSLWVQTALRQRRFTLHAVGTHDNVADVGTKALAVQKLEKFRDELGVIPEEEFRETDEPKTHMRQGSVGAVQMQTMMKVMLALGLIQPGKAEGEIQLWSPTGGVRYPGWIFNVVFMFNVVQFSVMMLWMLWIAINAVRKWMKPESHETESARTQRAGKKNAEAGRKEEKQGEENQGLRRRGATSSAAGSSSEMVRPQGGDPTEERQEVQYYCEKKDERETFDKCYPYKGGTIPKFYKSKSGECLHMTPDCRGLRNRKSPVELFRVCAYCHEVQEHEAVMMLKPGAEMLRRIEAETSRDQRA